MLLKQLLPLSMHYLTIMRRLKLVLLVFLVLI